MALVFITLAFAALMCETRVAQATSQHMICKTVENVSDDQDPAASTPRHSRANQGPQGKRGPSGVKGERGMPGPEGLPGVVDYQSVENVLQEKVVADRICRLGGGLVYSGKCYFAVVNNVREVTFDGGYADCLNGGGKPANVVSTIHQTEITNYLRTKIPFSQTSVYVWVGMTYKGNTLLYSDGTTTPALKWFPGYPNSELTGIGIQANQNPSSARQGLFTYGNSNTQWGVLCEK